MLSVLHLSFQNEKTDSELKLQDPSLEKLVQNLTHLKELYLDQVDISSSVPIILANLTFLKVVWLRMCHLYGQFPASIFHLPHLEVLYLDGNQDIEGFLPEFQDNSPLREPILSGRKLPSSIGKLANLEV